jgi:hypothetical protein
MVEYELALATIHFRSQPAIAIIAIVELAEQRYSIVE